MLVLVRQAVITPPEAPGIEGERANVRIPRARLQQPINAFGETKIRTDVTMRSESGFTQEATILATTECSSAYKLSTILAVGVIRPSFSALQIMSPNDSSLENAA
jgi:hypothetical protein